MDQQAARFGVCIARYHLSGSTLAAESEGYVAALQNGYVQREKRIDQFKPRTRSKNLIVHFLFAAHTDSKMDKKDPIEAINQICEAKNCNKAIYILNRRKKDSYLWVSNVPRGPSALFLIENCK